MAAHRIVNKQLCSALLKQHKSIEIMSQFSIDIGDMRSEYKKKNEAFLERDLISKEPYGQFKAWFDEVKAVASIKEPNAMCLATCSKDGIPSARIVLLKRFGSDGFSFYTNRGSRKGCDLESNPRAALVFYWEHFNRSVRVEGRVEKLSDDNADTYFHARPRESQLGACLMQQSAPVISRQFLVSKQDDLREKYKECDVPKPKEWGGYLVRPFSIEFWQGQTDRVHDRIRFKKPQPNDQVDGELLHEGDDGWVYERLAP